MITDLRPYPAMKDSGVEWLGEVPEHWDVAPNRAFFDEIKDRDCPDEQMLSVTIKRGVIKQASLLENTSKKDSSNLDRSNYKLVQPGDIAYNKMRAWQGAIGVSSYRGIISPAYVVQRPRDGGEPGYFHQLFRIPSFAKEAERWSYGITSDMWSLRPEHFKLIYSCLPPLPDQAAIVRYLDQLDRRVRRLVRAKRKLIALLTEQKQAIIHRAVTRGLDPDVPLKDSGVEWLGEVPEHWEALKLARVIADGPRNGISPPIDEKGTIESFSISAIRDGRVDVRDGDKKYIAGNKADLESSYRLLPGDVLLVRGNGNIRLVGKTGLVEDDMPGRVYPDLLMRIRLTRRCSPRYLVLLMSCSIARDQVETAARTAVGTFKINNQQVRQFRFAFPPVSEQEDIIGWLDEELSTINAASSRAEDEIRLLNEYRSRLIADVVTGKLDVREAADALPEVDPLDAESDLGDSLDAEAEADLDDLDEIPEEAEA